MIFCRVAATLQNITNLFPLLYVKKIQRAMLSPTSTHNLEESESSFHPSLECGRRCSWSGSSLVSSHCSRRETAVDCSYITLPRPGLWPSPTQPWTWLLLFWYTYESSMSPALTFGWILSINTFAVLSLRINEWNWNLLFLILKLHDFCIWILTLLNLNSTYVWSIISIMYKGGKFHQILFG